MFIGDLTASYKIRNHKWPFRVLRSPTFLDPDALALFGFCRVQDLDLRCDMCDIVVYDCNKQHPLKTHCEQSQCAWAHMWAAVMADKQPSLFAWAQGDTDPTGVRMQNLFIRTFTAWPYENTPNLSARSVRRYSTGQLAKWSL